MNKDITNTLQTVPSTKGKSKSAGVPTADDGYI